MNYNPDATVGLPEPHDGKAISAAPAPITVDADGPVAASTKKAPQQTGTSPRKKQRKPVDTKHRTREQPTRPLSAYNCFFREERAKILAERASQADGAAKETGAVLFSSMGKTIGKRWKQLPKEDRERFQEMAKQDLVRYRREMAVYNQKKNKEASEKLGAITARLAKTQRQERDHSRSPVLGDDQLAGALGAAHARIRLQGNRGSGSFHEQRTFAYPPVRCYSETQGLLALAASRRREADAAAAAAAMPLLTTSISASGMSWLDLSSSSLSNRNRSLPQERQASSAMLLEPEAQVSAPQVFSARSPAEEKLPDVDPLLGNLSNLAGADGDSFQVSPVASAAAFAAMQVPTSAMMTGSPNNLSPQSLPEPLHSASSIATPLSIYQLDAAGETEQAEGGGYSNNNVLMQLLQRQHQQSAPAGSFSALSHHQASQQQTALTAGISPEWTAAASASAVNPPPRMSQRVMSAPPALFMRGVGGLTDAALQLRMQQQLQMISSEQQTTKQAPCQAADATTNSAAGLAVSAAPWAMRDQQQQQPATAMQEDSSSMSTIDELVGRPDSSSSSSSNTPAATAMAFLLSNMTRPRQGASFDGSQSPNIDSSPF